MGVPWNLTIERQPEDRLWWYKNAAFIRQPHLKIKFLI